MVIKMYNSIISNGTNRYMDNGVYDTHIARQLYFDNKFTLLELRIMKHKNIKEALTKDNRNLLSDARIAIFMLEGSSLDNKNDTIKEKIELVPFFKTEKLGHSLSEAILHFYRKYYETNGKKKTNLKNIDIERENIINLHKRLCESLLIFNEVYKVIKIE